MALLCATRHVKNARHLQSTAPDLLPREEPLEGYASRIPFELLGRLHLARPNELAVHRDVAEALRRSPIPKPRTRVATPLFNGPLVFAQVSFRMRGGAVAVPAADLDTAMAFARLAVGPISRYAAQYGPNQVTVSPNRVPFTADVQAGRYNDQILQGWVNAIVSQANLPANACVVVLNPRGVVNSDADPSQGVGGYHGLANVPYCFVNAMGGSFTVPDEANIYALALSHEIAEMVVDPRADLGNPEVCDPCIPGDEIILGDNKPISEYMPGDRVVSANGLQSVVKAFIRTYEGDLLEIKALGMLPFRVTPNHPLLIVRGRSRGATVNYQPSGWRQARGVRPKVRFRDGDYLVMPRLRGTVSCDEVSLLPYIHQHRTTLKQTGQGAQPFAYPHSEAFPLTRDTAWMLGLYVAEGSANPAHRSVEFSLHRDETAVVGKLRRVARQLGHRLWVDPIVGERAVKAHLASVILCKFLPDVCGKGASRKRIPDFVLYNSREEILRAFLDGYMVGDGSKERTKAGYKVLSFSTVSKTLALQLQLAYGRLGVFISLRRKRPAQTAVILGRTVQMKETYRGLWCSDLRATRRKRLHRLGHEEAFFLPVKGIRRITFSGSVHNLETKDHTYLVSNVVSHNCGPNCQTVWLDYFDAEAGYLGTSQRFPPSFSYGFFINGIVRPDSANLCPAPAAACNYAPP